MGERLSAASTASRIFESVRYDLRFALRALTRRPTLAVIATLSLAVGIAINVAFFTVMNAMLLRDLGVPDESSLVMITRPLLTLAQQVALREEVMPRGEVFGFRQAGTLRIEDGAGEAASEIVSDNYFAALGLRATAGHLFEPGDDALGNGQMAVVLSHSLWHRSFGSDPSIVGRTIRLSGSPARVVSIGPRGFRGLYGPQPADIWSVAFRREALTSKGPANWNGMVRLHSGVALEGGSSAVELAVGHLAGLDSNALRGGHVLALVKMKRIVWLLVTAFMAVPGLVLLVACANVSGLLAARAEERKEEMAIRMAVGGNRTRLVRQLLSEGVLLALGGAAVGLLLGRWIVDGVSPWLLPTLANFAMYPDLSLDGRAVAVSLTFALVAAIASSLLPALAASRRDLASLLKRDTGGWSGRRWRVSSRDVLVVAQLVVTFSFLVTAILCARSFRSGVSVPLGFAPERLLAANIRLPDEARRASGPLLDALLNRVGQVPGIQRMTIAETMPAMPGPRLPVRTVADPADVDAQTVSYNRVRPEYLAMTGLRLLEGRFIDGADVATGRGVAVVSSALAHRLWAEEDPLGRTLRIGSDTRDLEVVGVVDDPAQVAQVERRPGSRGEPILYMPLDAGHLARMATVVLIVEGPRAALLAPGIEKAVQDLSPGMAILGVRTLADLNRAGLVQAEITMVLYTLLGILCGVLGAVGLYGAIAQIVALRTPEMGLRMALGATRRDVLGLVLYRGMALAAAGVALGVPGAFAAVRIFGSAVLDMPSVDLPTLATVAALVLATALAATYVPARRASRVDPMTALRYE